jgi:hypothetical protein
MERVALARPLISTDAIDGRVLVFDGVWQLLLNRRAMVGPDAAQGAELQLRTGEVFTLGEESIYTDRVN